ncbi:MAG: TlpA family protein disulfide reductase [Planctomycetes bacterium]|nr:TlpA family protein disulfide reductase [Planctomycetota bacterium]
MMLALQAAPPSDKPFGGAPSGTPPAPPPATTDAPAKPKITPIGVGSPAPKLSVDIWVKGDPVAAIEPGKVHVVEFWATWCGPCIQAMPHLSEVQKRHPELIVISVAGMERGAPGEAGKPDARLEKVRAMVERKKDVMGYRVAYDGDESMLREWLVPARQRSIPCAMVIGRDGRIAWMGHPLGMDAAVEKALQQSAPGDSGGSTPPAP